MSYLPAESDTGMFGGNSNWRGPIWMPVNALIIRALLQYYLYYGDAFTVECPTRSGRQMNLYQVAEEIARRLAGIFLRGKDGRRPVYGGCPKFQEDPHWRDHLLLYEYFHGDNGAGLGASHQTGWTGIIARTLHLFAATSAEQIREGGKKGFFQRAAINKETAATSTCNFSKTLIRGESVFAAHSHLSVCGRFSCMKKRARRAVSWRARLGLEQRSVALSGESTRPDAGFGRGREPDLVGNPKSGDRHPI